MQAVSDIVPFRFRRRPEDTTAFIGMVIFLGGWSLMFGGLFFAYALLRYQAPMWPPPEEPRLPLLLPALGTLLLGASSFTLSAALRGVRAARPLALRRGMVATLVLGAGFLAVQVAVWWTMWHAGLRPSSGLYGSVFYALTLFHGLHVLAGLVGLGAIYPAAHRGRYSVQMHTPVRVWTLFWHFVDAVWLLTFVTVYVL